MSVLLAIYGAALCAASPVAGSIADRTPNRRLPLLIGLIALAGSTLLLCLGRTLGLLVLGRLLQGISAAVVWTVGLALMADTVGSVGIGQAVGYVSMSMSIAILIGPLLGGVVYDRVGYYSVFYLAFGMIILDILLRVALVEKCMALKWAPQEDYAVEKTGPEDKVTPSSPVPPAMPMPMMCSPQQDPITQSHQSTSALAAQCQTAIPPATAAPPIAPFRSHLLQRLRKRSRTLSLLSSPRLWAALFATMAQSSLLTAWDAVLPLQVSSLFGWSSLGAGLIFLPLILPAFLSPFIGIWADKRGPHGLVVSGFLTMIPPLVCLRFADTSYLRHANGGTRPKSEGGGLSEIGMIVLICALLAIIGLGLAMSIVPLLAEVVHVCEVGESESEREHLSRQAGLQEAERVAYQSKSTYATAYGLFNVAYAAGLLIGPLWGGLVRVGAGWGTMCWSLGLMSLSGAAVSFWGVGEGGGKSVRKWKQRIRRKQPEDVDNVVRDEEEGKRTAQGDRSVKTNR